MTKKLHLIRHGATPYTEKKFYCGHTDLSLSELGVSQVEELKSQITDLSPSIVYTSDLKRAIETAAILFPNSGFKQVPEVREMSFGDWEGKPWDVVSAENPELYQNWVDNIVHEKVPGGERLSDVYERLKTTLPKILKEHTGGDLVIVCHGGIISLLRCYFEDHDLSSFGEFIPKPASLTTLDT